jgi:hypothetical protein
MDRKVSFSNQHQELLQIESHHADVTFAISEYFRPRTGEYPERFLGYSIDELKSELTLRLAEIDITSSLSLLSAIEAAFRIDYLQRCYMRKKDPLSRTFREIHKHKGSMASLEDDILDTWKQCTIESKEILGHLKGALKYRHWIAHGRYWEPKLGRSKYDYQSVYQLAQTVFLSFPFVGV